MRAARSIADRTVTELLVMHQNQQQLSTQLWTAVKNRGCQFLGPVMQEEALKLVLMVCHISTSWECLCVYLVPVSAWCVFNDLTDCTMTQKLLGVTYIAPLV